MFVIALQVFGVICGLLITSVAQATLTCTDANSCFMNMPLYNQCDNSIGSFWLPNGGGGSMLCGPTSASMALEGAINSKSSLDLVTGWSNSSFQSKTWQNRVRDMATLVGCSPTGGTYFGTNSLGVAGRSGDFNLKIFGLNIGLGNGYSTSWSVPLSNSSFVTALRHGYATVFLHGHYTQKTVNVLGTEFVTYTRYGGHFIAVSGHWSNNWIYLNNPWGGINQWYSIGQLQAGAIFDDNETVGRRRRRPVQVTTLPDGQSSQGFLYSSGDYYAILEGYSALTAY